MGPDMCSSPHMWGRRVALQSLCVLFYLFLCYADVSTVYSPLVLYAGTEEVFVNVAFTTCCGVAAMWYFVPQNTSGVVKGALRRASTYSFGSICFGSLIVSILKTLRFVFFFFFSSFFYIVVVFLTSFVFFGHFLLLPFPPFLGVYGQ